MIKVTLKRLREVIKVYIADGTARAYGESNRSRGFAISGLVPHVRYRRRIGAGTVVYPSDIAVHIDLLRDCLQHLDHLEESKKVLKRIIES